MDVHAKLAEIRRVVEQARSMPMSASAVVNRGELLAALDELGAGLDAAFSGAQAVLDDREGMVAEGRTEAGRIIAEAHDERDKILSDTEVFRVAKRQADEVLEHARADADGLRKETDDYVDGRLATFEITLERTIEAVRRGRERLADRSRFDALDDDVAAIRLPDHLDG